MQRCGAASSGKNASGRRWWRRSLLDMLQEPIYHSLVHFRPTIFFEIKFGADLHFLGARDSSDIRNSPTPYTQGIGKTIRTSPVLYRGRYLPWSGLLVATRRCCRVQMRCCCTLSTMNEGIFEPCSKRLTSCLSVVIGLSVQKHLR